MQERKAAINPGRVAGVKVSIRERFEAIDEDRNITDDASQKMHKAKM